MLSEREWKLEDDVVFKRTGLTVGEVAGVPKDLYFGFEPYTMPVEDLKYRITNPSYSREKRIIEFEKVALKLKKFPGPNQYSKVDNWENNFKKPRGCFLKKKRETFTGEIIRKEKPKMAPNKYKPEPVIERVTGFYDP